MGEGNFCTLLLVRVGIVQYANSGDINPTVYSLNLSIMKDILDMVKNHVKENENIVSNQINNHLYKTFIGRLDLDYDYADDLKDWEKVRFIFNMVMETYMKIAYGQFIFNI